MCKSIQVWTYTSKDTCKYASSQAARYTTMIVPIYVGSQVCKYASMHEWMYKSLQVFKRESKKVCMCASMHGWTHEKLHKIEIMQVYKYQVCKYISMQIFICIFIQVCRRTSM